MQSNTPIPPPRKRLFIQMSGAPGSGKSTLARLTARSLGAAVVLDHDIIRSSLLKPLCSPSSASSTPGTATNNPIPFDQAAQHAYNLQWALAEDMARQGCLDVIVDSTCTYKEVVDKGKAIAERHGYEYWYVECMVGAGDVELLDKRLKARKPMASQRMGVDEAPPAFVAGQVAAGAGGGGEGEESSRARFLKWMTSPSRPEDDENMMILDGTSMEPQMMRDVVLSGILKLHDF